MIKFSDGFLETLKSRVDLVDVVSQHVPLQKRGREFVACCPFHQEKTPSFTVSNIKGFYHCFGCGAHGSAIDFVMQKENLNFPEAVQRLAHQFGVPMPQEQVTSADIQKKTLEEDLVRIHEIACGYFTAQLQTSYGESARQYLKKRGIQNETCQEFRLGFSPNERASLYSFVKKNSFSEEVLRESGLFVFPEEGGSPYDKFRGRLMFPILNQKGDVIAFGGRLLGPGEPKYLNSPETPIFKKSFELYNLHRAKQSKTSDPWCIVEGYMDVIALVQAGYETAVAPLGTAFTEHQMAKIWRFSNEPVLCFDGDRAGLDASLRAAKRVLPFLRPAYSLSFMFLPEGHDPDSFIVTKGIESFREHLHQQSIPLSQVIWRDILNQGSLKTPEGKAHIKKLIRETVERIEDVTLRSFYQKDLDQKLFDAQRLSVSKKGMAPLKAWKPSIDPFLREKILLTIFLNQPVLIEIFEEELVSIEFTEETFNNLKKDLLDYYYSKKRLEKETLIAHLKEQGYERVLSELMKESTRIHLPSVNPENIEELAAECRDVLGAFKDPQRRKEDLESAKEVLKNTFDEAAWLRFQALKRSFNKKE